jgi:hypothetical protein
MHAIAPADALRLFHLFAAVFAEQKSLQKSHRVSKNRNATNRSFPMNRGTLLTVIGTILSVGALAAWAFVAPAAGSGWILFVAFIGAMNLLNSINNTTLATISGVVIAAASGFIWFTHQTLPDVGWVGFLSILTAIGALNALNSGVSRNT